MREASDLPEDYARRLAFIREETRFEVGLLHDRINALISAEAFLTIAFTMAMSNTNARWGITFSVLVAPLLSLLGLILAVLAWPGVDASFKIIVEWSARQIAVMQENPEMTALWWRLPVMGKDNRRADPDLRNSMRFARTVPIVFGIAWAVLTAIALVLPLRH
jgi:hypothetical protein